MSINVKKKICTGYETLQHSTDTLASHDWPPVHSSGGIYSVTMCTFTCDCLHT